MAGDTALPSGAVRDQLQGGDQRLREELADGVGHELASGEILLEAHEISYNAAIDACEKGQP